jgi:hypothetical protein
MVILEFSSVLFSNKEGGRVYKMADFFNGLYLKNIVIKYIVQTQVYDKELCFKMDLSIV